MKYFFLIFFISFSALSQEVSIEKHVAYIDGKVYLKIEKENRKKYFIKDIETGDKILKVEIFKAYNSKDKRSHKLPRVYFLEENKKMEFEAHIKSETDLVEFLHEFKIVLKDGSVNNKVVNDYYDYLLKNHGINLYEN